MMLIPYYTLTTSVPPPDKYRTCILQLLSYLQAKHEDPLLREVLCGCAVESGSLSPTVRASRVTVGHMVVFSHHHGTHQWM